MIYFELGGIAVPTLAILDFSQTYDAVRQNTIKRKVDGTGLLHSSPLSGKIRTRLSGKGWSTAGLNGLDYSQAMTLKCAVPMGVNSASNVIVIPAARRSDVGYEPAGFVILADGSRVSTGFDSVVTDTYTLTTVAGASFYQVEYFPQISVLVTERPSDDIDYSRVDYSWSLVAEQI